MLRERKKIILGLTVFIIIFNLLFFYPLTAVKAQITDPVQAVLQPAKWVWERLKDVKEFYDKHRDFILFRAGRVAYKNALRTLLSRLAYDAATNLAEGDWGKSPLFSTKNFGDFLGEVADTTLVDTLDILAKDNGFFEFDVCQPENINLKFAIHYALFKERKGRGEPKCTWRQITEKWDEWASTVGTTFSSENFLATMKDAFKPEQSDVGIYLTLDSSIRSKLKDEETKQTFDQLANARFKAVTEPITGFIKTPAKVSETYATQLATDAPISEDVPTGDIVADALGIFTNTLAAKLMKRLLQKGLTEGQRAQSTLAYKWTNRELAKAGAAEQFVELAEVNFPSGEEDALSQITQCADSKNPGPMDCVLSNRLTTALEQGLTVKEAVAKNSAIGSWPLGFLKSGEEPDFRSGFPYRSLVILRTLRVIPVAWELAAMYFKKFGKTPSISLSYLLGCYEDPAAKNDPRKPDGCREDINNNGSIDAGDYNPYWHLVDPNWVLKLPQTYCQKQGPGPVIATELSPVIDPATGREKIDPVTNKKEYLTNYRRDSEYCGDRRSCLKESSDGTCLSYGYCVKEESIWSFGGGSCPDYYNSCETFTRSPDNQTFSYLRDTLKECVQTEGLASPAGCQWYSTTQTKNPVSGVSEWQDNSRIYLNNQAKQCDAKGAGCTKVSRMLPGVNLTFNGDFTLSDDNVLPNGWTGGNAACASYQADGGINNTGGLKLVSGGSTCSSFTAGFIPADPNFGYTLTLASRLASEGNNSLPVYLYIYNSAFNQIGEVRQIFTEEEAGQVGTAEWHYLNKEISDLPPATRYLKIKLSAQPNLTVFFDNIQLIISRSPVPSQNLANFAVNQEIYQTDYSQNNTYARQYLKVAPDWLKCEGYDKVLTKYRNTLRDIEQCDADGHYWRSDINRCVESGNPSCASYAAFCKADEIGCQGYSPTSGGPEVSATVNAADQCPSECAGYESYLQLPTYFDTIENSNAPNLPQNFIPQTAKACSALDAGCEQFTNLTNESIEYFTYLRQCVSPNNSNIGAYYTWEGSDTTGYQLKKWEFLKSNQDSGPCTNINIGTEQCQDPEDPANNLGICTQDDYGIDPNCRDFFNTGGEHFLRWQDRTITASTECHPYNRTVSGQTYNADPSEGRTCEPVANGCREYKGNQAGNVRNVIFADFENQITGSFKNSAGTSAGLTPSNESIYQGGHSLLVYTQNGIVAHPLTGLVSEAGKQYQLTFWAKKGLGEKASVQNITQGKTLLPFNLNSRHLTNQWQEFKLGPVELDELGGNQPELRLNVTGLSGDEVFYLDNFILKEYTSTFYLISDSWRTPASCDTPSPGAQLGCQQYVDRKNQTHFLKTFANSCSSSAIGCEAYLNTQNSTAYQAEKVYKNGVCNEDVGEIRDDKCYIRGQGMCDVPGNAVSCNYDITSVPNDQLAYLVNDPSKQCSAQLQGCELTGLPSLNRQIEDYTDPGYITGYSNTYIVNNPDLYGSQLCSESGLFCTAFNGQTSGNKAYYDPASEAGGRLCQFDGQSWKISGTDEACPGAGPNGYLNTNQEDLYDDWIGLCEPKYSSCTEFRDPEKPITAGPAGAAECDAQIPPQLSGRCVVGQNGASSPDGQYCQIDVNNSGITHNVCELKGGTACDYTASGWFCTNPDANGKCNVPDTDSVACYATQGQSRCTYSLVCQPYYQLASETEACSGNVDREAGCLLFNNAGLNQPPNLSSDLTKDGMSPQTCGSNVFSDPNDCDANQSRQVRRDRECGEWLYCSSSLEVTNAQGQNERICLDIGRCSEMDPSNPSGCSNIIAGNGNEQTYTAAPVNSQVDELKNLSGYSRAGLNWENQGAVNGYFAPEKMSQTGEKLSINNGNFEEPINDNNWKVTDGDCSPSPLVASSISPYSGRYSLRLNNNAGGTTCILENQAAGNDGYYLVDRSNTYVLSYTLRSEATGGAPSTTMPLIGFRAFDSSKNQLAAPAGGFGTYFGNWTKGRLEISSANMPVGTVFIKPIFHSSLSAGAVYFDDISIEPVLNVSDENQTTKECRLYPREDSPVCEYQDLIHYRGWSGYCLEPDPANPANCLQWYPVDNIAGDALLMGGDEGIGYQDRAPLYYCLQSKGNYNRPLNNGTPNNPNDDLIKFTSSYRGYVLLETYPLNEDFNYRRPIVTQMNGGVDCDDNAVEDIVQCREMVARGVCGCDNNESINNVTFNADSEDQYYENELERIEWVVQRSSHGDWWEAGSKFITNSANAWTSNNLTNRNYFNIKVNFNNNTKKLESFKVFLADFSGDDGGLWVAGIAYLREPCTYIAQAVDTNGSDPIEKVRYDRFNYGWDTGEGNPMGYSRSLAHAPFGSILPENNSNPADGSWPLLYVNFPADDRVSSAGLPMSVSGNYGERQCISSSDPEKIGDSCLSNTDCDNGECAGIGKYCYDSSGLTNGARCSDKNSDCTVPYNNDCRAPGVDNDLTIGLDAALLRLQQLYAKVYGVWQWNGVRYGDITDNYTEDILDISDDAGRAPTITNIRLNGQNADINLKASGANKVDLSFSTNVEDNQLPIVYIQIDWQDGSDPADSRFSGTFNHRPAESNPHKISHYYACEPTPGGDKCQRCFGNRATLTDGVCNYPGPKITVQDNWDWCAGGTQVGEGSTCDIDNTGVSFGHPVRVGAVNP